MTQTPTPVIEKATNRLAMIEKALLTALAIGLILMAAQIDSSLAKVSLIGLAVVFFLSAFRPPDIKFAEDEQLGFSELLALIITPKVLWISSALSALGIAFYLIDFGNEGYENLLMIGALTIGIGTLILLISIVTGVKYTRRLAPILLRAVPLFLANMYILFR